MAVKSTGSLSLTEINTEWSLGFDLDSYRGTQWFLSPAYNGPSRSPRGTFGPLAGSNYTSVSYSDFYGTQSLPPPMTAGVWLVGGGGGAGGTGGGGGGGGVRAANVSLNAGSNYTVTVGAGGAGGYRNHPSIGPAQESTDGGASYFGSTYVGGGGGGSSGGQANPLNNTAGHGHSWGWNSGPSGAPKFAPFNTPVAHPLGGGGGGATAGNEYRIGGLRGGYGQNGGNNIGFGPSQANQPYAMGGGGGGGPQAQRGWNGWRQGLGYNQNFDHYGNLGSGRGSTMYNTHIPAPTMNPASPNQLNRAGPGGRGSYSWAPLNMGWHGGGGGGGSNSGFYPHWGHAGSGGAGGGAAGASNPQTGGNWHKNGNNGGTNTGGGAGGGGSSNSSPHFGVHRGGNGGSGVVYLRYTAPQIGHGGPNSSHCVYVSGGYYVHKWTGNGYYSHNAGDNPVVCPGMPAP